MKKSLLLLLLITIHQCLHAQSVGIGTNTPDSSAALEINSTNKGLLLPRINDTASIKRPVRGLLVYNNSDNMPWYYNGNRWQKTIPGAVMESEFAGQDSLWYKRQDSIAYTYYPYVQINNNLNLVPLQANLQVTGNLLVQPKLSYSNSTPTPAQIYTMNNTASQSIPGSDSVFYIYDPGGVADYNNNMQGNINTSALFTNGAGLKVSSDAANFGIGSGDTLWIAGDGFPECRTRYFYFFTNTTLNPGDFTLSSDAAVYFIFRSNADGMVGKGFKFLITRLYNLENYKKISTAGPALYFNSATGAFGAGIAANANAKNSIALGSNTIASGSFAAAIGSNTNASGNYSIALGTNTTASGAYTTAMGLNTIASSGYTTAMGLNTIASGESSVAMGNNAKASGVTSLATGGSTTASGNYSTAMGGYTTASGYFSTATGRKTTASGDRSTAMGNYVSTNNQEGSFIIGDNSTTTLMNSANANNFRARFAGGYKLFTSANLSTGCTLFAGDNAWTTGSDVGSKENFAEVNGEDFLKKIAGFHLTSWNYKTQNPKTFRHYGPMAQDFYAAFGKDKYGTIGNDTTINSADFAGVSFIAIQALEKRTQKIEQLEKEVLKIKELEKENAGLKTMLMQLRKEVDALQGIKKENL